MELRVWVTFFRKQLGVDNMIGGGALGLEPCSKSRIMETTIRVDLVVSVIIQTYEFHFFWLGIGGSRPYNDIIGGEGGGA